MNNSDMPASADAEDVISRSTKAREEYSKIMSALPHVSYSEWEKTKQPNEKHYEKVEKGYAIFMAWGLDYQELDSGVGSFSTAIISLDDGTIKNVPCDMIRFLKAVKK